MSTRLHFWSIRLSITIDFFGEGEICLVLKRGNWTSFIGMTQMVFAILAYISCLNSEFGISGQQPPFLKELPSCWHVIMWLTYKLYMNTIMESCSHWWIIGKIRSSSNDHQSLIVNSFVHASTSIEWFDFLSLLFSTLIMLTTLKVFVKPT